MEYWEFLLQQEGDSNWLPLDTSQMEILEGRYRIMAHCSQTEVPVQVHVSQLLTDQMPPKRRSLKRQGLTNDNGLLVVLPFTRLTAGTWDIYCQGLPLTEPSAPAPEAEAVPQTEVPWRFAIQLRVLPQGVGEDGDWFADEGHPSSLTENSPVSAGTDDTPAPTAAEPAPTAGAIYAGIDLQQLAELLDQAQSPSGEVDTEADTLYTLTLPQTAFMVSRGQAFQLTGEVSSVLEGESCSDMALVVRLSDPQTAQQLSLDAFRLDAIALPSPFSVTLNLPESLSTRLVLGELALVSRQANALDVLALKQFTVTVDLAALFDEIANQAEDDGDAGLRFAPDKLVEAETSDQQQHAHGDSGWADLDFPPAPPRSVPAITLPRGNSTIPPKIYYPSPHEVSARQPALPPLGEQKPTPMIRRESPTVSTEIGGDEETPEASTPQEDPVKSATAEVSTANPAPSAQKLSLPSLKTASAGTAPDQAQANASGTSAGETAHQPSSDSSGSEPLMLPSHEAVAFQALNLQERFWTRLNDLAVTIQAEAQQAGQDIFDADPALAAEPLEDDQPAFIPFAGEVVIYEEDTVSQTPPLTQEAATELVERLQREEESEVVTPPVPEVELASTELTAGETVLLTIRVPFHPNRLYIKVWITDPQTRSLTDEPRQITHLAPNGRGQLEGSIQLTVPMGCLEIWLEAIAVDMVTQQESYKATVPCSVNPLGIESSSLDEFEL